MDFTAWDAAFSAVWSYVGRPGHDVPEGDRFFYFDVGYPPKQAAIICASNDPENFR